MSSSRRLRTRCISFFNWDSWSYWILYFMLVIAFTYFYTDVIFRQQNLAETLQRQGGFIPGIRPGINTERYLQQGACRASPWWARCSWAAWRSCPGSST